VVNTSFLNIRSGPSAAYTILVTVVGGTELPVLGVARDRVWYQVATDVGPGWVNVSFTLPRGDFTRVPFAEAGDVPVIVSLGQGGGGGVPGVTAGAGGGLTTDRQLRPWGVSVLGGDLRDGPSDKARKIALAMAPRTDQVHPLLGQAFAEGRQWFLASIAGTGTGWNEAHLFVLRPLLCSPGQSVVVMTRGTALTPGPDASNVPDGANINAGAEAYVINVSSGQAKLELIDGTQGWVPVDATQGRSNDVISFCGGNPVTSNDIASGAVNPGIGGGATTTGGQTTVGGIPINISPGVITFPITGPHVVVNTGNLNIRSGPSDGFSIIATVPGGTKLPVIGIARDGVWVWVEGTFGRGWVNNQYTLFRGDIGSVPVVDFRNIGAG
jgi:uncharacterized protein YgiM (DUF1202 family)